MTNPRATEIGIFHLLLIITIGAGIYLNSLEVPFQFDDILYIKTNATIRHFPNLIENVERFGWQRFIGYTSFALNYFFHGLDVGGYHVVNIVIHVLNGMLVYWLMGLMLRRQKSDRAEAVSLAAALLFVCHPIQTQAVTYLTQRFTSLATFFYLLSVCLYLHTRLSVKDPGSRVLFFLLTACAALMGMFTKQIVFTLPFMIVLVELMFVPRDKKENFSSVLWRLLIPVLLLTAVIPLTYGLGAFSILSKSLSAGNFVEGAITSDTYFMTQVGVLLRYLSLMLIPVGQTVDHYVPVTANVLNPLVLSSLGILSLVLALALNVRRTHRIMAFGIFWFFMTSMVESGLIPIKHLMFEHRMYLPSVGIMMTFVMLLDAIIKKDRNFNLLIAILVTIASLLTIARNSVWQDEITLWTDAMQKSPANPRPYYNLGVAYMNKGNIDEARRYYDKAIGLYPRYFEAYNNRANIYSLQGNFELALQDINSALELQPNMAVAYTTRGSLLQSKGDCEGAIKDFTKSIELDRELTGAYINRGLCYGAQGIYNLALEDLNRAIEQDENLPKIYNNRGAIYLKKKDFEAALKDFNQALRLDPNYVDALINRALVYFTESRWDLALIDYTTVLEIQPQNPKALFLRGKAYQAKNEMDSALLDYNALLKQQPKNLTALTHRAFVNTVKNNFAAALEDYDVIIRINPQLIQAYLERGKLYYRLKDYKKARENYETAIGLDPDSGQGYFLRALTLYELKEFQMAYDDLIRAQQREIEVDRFYLLEFKKAIDNRELK